MASVSPHNLAWMLRMPGVLPMTKPKHGTRFLLWIDEVGGYLVCLSDRVTLGQPVVGDPVEIPILGDISRRHATIERDTEGYVLRPIRPTFLDGQRVENPRELKDSETIALGGVTSALGGTTGALGGKTGGVQLAFRRPHALSMTARLDLVSRNRFEPAVDAAILMADTCILGPKLSSHIVCPGWNQEVVLFRQGDRIFCRTGGSLEVDGKRVDTQNGGRPAEVTWNSRISGSDFALSLESL